MSGGNNVLKEVAGKIINDDGEVYDEIYVGDKILRGESLKYYNETFEIGKGERFYKVWECARFELDNETLTGSQWRLLSMLGHYIQYKSCVVIHPNGRHVTLEAMSKILDMPERTVYNSLEKLIKKKIIAKVKIGYDIKYLVNPFIFAKGKRMNKTLIDIFGDSKWAALHKDIE